MKASNRMTTSYPAMVKNAIEKDLKNEKLLNNIISNKNVNEHVKLSGIISQMIHNEYPHPHDDDSKRSDEFYKDLEFDS